MSSNRKFSRALLTLCSRISTQAPTAKKLPGHRNQPKDPVRAAVHQLTIKTDNVMHKLSKLKEKGVYESVDTILNSFINTVRVTGDLASPSMSLATVNSFLKIAGAAILKHISDSDMSNYIRNKLMKECLQLFDRRHVKNTSAHVVNMYLGSSKSLNNLLTLIAAGPTQADDSSPPDSIVDSLQYRIVGLARLIEDMPSQSLKFRNDEVLTEILRWLWEGITETCVLQQQQKNSDIIPRNMIINRNLVKLPDEFCRVLTGVLNLTVDTFELFDTKKIYHEHVYISVFDLYLRLRSRKEVVAYIQHAFHRGKGPWLRILNYNRLRDAIDLCASQGDTASLKAIAEVLLLHKGVLNPRCLHHMTCALISDKEKLLAYRLVKMMVEKDVEVNIKTFQLLYQELASEGLDKEAEWLYSLSAQVYGPEVMHQPHLLAAGPTQRLACDRACSLIRLGDNQGLQRHLAGCEQAWSKSGAGNVASLYNTVVLVLIDKSWDEAALVVHRMLILGIQPSEKIVVALLDAALGSGREVRAARLIDAIRSFKSLQQQQKQQMQHDHDHEHASFGVKELKPAIKQLVVDRLVVTNGLTSRESRDKDDESFYEQHRPEAEWLPNGG